MITKIMKKNKSEKMHDDEEGKWKVGKLESWLNKVGKEELGLS